MTRHLFHILDYHNWHSSKKISSRRKHRRGKHALCCGFSETVSFKHYADEAHDYLNADVVPLVDEQKTSDANATNRNSAKARIKAAIAKEMSAKSQMQRTDSSRCLMSSDSLSGSTPDWSNPIIILDKSADAAAAESRLQIPSSDSTKLSREISDVLEIFKVNKNMFLEILEDPDVEDANNFHFRVNSNAKARLKKSGSFPLARSPDNNKHLKPSKLEDKSRENWSSRKGENFNLNESKSLEDFLQMPKDIQASDALVLAVSEESSFSPSQLSHGSNKGVQNHSFMSHIKYVMKKIKHGLRESKRQNYQRPKDVSGMLEDNSTQQDGSESHRSLSESMDRYAHLLESGFTRDDKWHEQKSKSLRLANEDKDPEFGFRIKSFKRRLSLQDPESLYPFSKETTREEHQSETPIKNVLDCDEMTENFAVEESELHENMAEEGTGCVNDQKALPKTENYLLLSEIEVADFDYVKDVLEVSGLIEQGYLGKWHSLEQPLSPTLFNELEIYLHCSNDACNHRLLFDSINEALVQVYARSLAYFPKNFSFDRSVCLLPKGSCILEEVWKRISSKSKMEQSVDDIVAGGLAKDASWLKLRLDLEDIALDLEDWIFDELVEEIMSS